MPYWSILERSYLQPVDHAIQFDLNDTLSADVATSKLTHIEIAKFNAYTLFNTQNGNKIGLQAQNPCKLS